MVKPSSNSRGRLTFALLITLLPACAEHAWMMVPPKLDLLRYERIGLIELRCTDSELQQQATRQFQELLLEARPGSHVFVVPGGGASARSGGELDSAALRALAAEQHLDAVFAGSLQLSGTKPSIGIASSLIEVNTRTEIVGTMNVRLIEPKDGATVWITTANERATVASGGLNSKGEGSFAMSDPQDVRRELVRALASDVTGDFRAQYFRKRVDDIPPGYRVTYPEGVAVYVPPDVPDAQH